MWLCVGKEKIYLLFGLILAQNIFPTVWLFSTMRTRSLQVIYFFPALETSFCRMSKSQHCHTHQQIHTAQNNFIERKQLSHSENMIIVCSFLQKTKSQIPNFQPINDLPSSQLPPLNTDRLQLNICSASRR